LTALLRERYPGQHMEVAHRIDRETSGILLVARSSRYTAAFHFTCSMCPGACAASTTFNPSRLVDPNTPLSMCQATRTVHSPVVGGLIITHGHAVSQLQASK